MSMLLHFVEYHKKHINRGVECLLMAAHYEQSRFFVGSQPIINWNYEQAQYHFKLAIDEARAAKDKLMLEAAKTPSDEKLQKVATLASLCVNRSIRAVWKVAGRALP